MSTVVEIEAAIGKLSAEEWRELRGWVLTHPEPTAPAKPKTGAELTSLWRHRFHLTTREADELAADLVASHQRPQQPQPVWE